MLFTGKHYPASTDEIDFDHVINEAVDRANVLIKDLKEECQSEDEEKKILVAIAQTILNQI